MSGAVSHFDRGWCVSEGCLREWWECEAPRFSIKKSVAVYRGLVAMLRLSSLIPIMSSVQGRTKLFLGSPMGLPSISKQKFITTCDVSHRIGPCRGSAIHPCAPHGTALRDRNKVNVSSGIGENRALDSSLKRFRCARNLLARPEQTPRTALRDVVLVALVRRFLKSIYCWDQQMWSKTTGVGIASLQHQLSIANEPSNSYSACCVNHTRHVVQGKPQMEACDWLHWPRGPK